MRCSVSRHLRAYLDDELPLPQRESVGRHLAACPQCRAELDGLVQVSNLLAELSPVPVPEHLAAVTLHRLRTQPSTPTVLARQAPAWAAAFAAAACLAVALHVLWPGEADDRRTPLRVVAAAEVAAPMALIITPSRRNSTRRLAAPHPLTLAPMAPRRHAAAFASAARKADVKAAVAGALPVGVAAQEAQATAALKAIRHHGSLQDPDLMAAALENVALAYPGTASAGQAMLSAGELQRQRGNLAEADAMYRRLLGMKSTGAMPQALAHKALGDLRAQSVGDDAVTRYHYQEATRVLRAEARGGASRHQALLAMADIARDTGDHDEAVADYAVAATQGHAEQAASSLAEVL